MRLRHRRQPAEALRAGLPLVHDFRIGPPQFQEPVNGTPVARLENVPLAATPLNFAAA